MARPFEQDPRSRLPLAQFLSLPGCLLVGLIITAGVLGLACILRVLP